MDVILWVLTYAPVFLLIISVVITVHELGHYWVGRMFGAAVESFAIGFGNPIVEKRDGRGTRWRLNWIPLGGFVKFVGEVQLAQDLKQELPQTAETEEEAARLAEVAQAVPPKGAREGRPTTFHDNQILVGRPYNLLNPWQRIAVSLGGPFANFLFAIAAFAVIGGIQGVPQAQEVFVRGVIAGEAAERAGFQTGDVVIEAGGRPVTTAQDIIMATQLSAGEAVRYRVLRGEETVALLATPVEQELVDSGMRMKQKVGRIGLDLGHRDTSIRNLNPVEAVGYGLQRTAESIDQTINVLRRLITGKEGIEKLSGPVGILHLTGGVTEMTMNQENVDLGAKFMQLFWMYFHLAALLSIGIGFFNLLPIPVLDGGAVVMTLAEAVTGKALPEKAQNAGLTFGLVSLVVFALLVTWQDIGRLISGFLPGPA
jgi:regulator of sigma E protease